MRIATATVVALSVCLAGCSGSSPGGSLDKAGGQVAPVVLTAVSPEGADRPSGAQLTAFVDAVDQLSQGRITVEPTFGVEDPRAVGPDQASIQTVQAGGVDLGLAAARAFSSEGVTSLRALTVPFLIETDSGAAAVARSDTIAGPMLAGLADAGLTGLALLPETIRHPFGVRGPILGPEDYAGAVLRSAPSEETFAVFEALGAKPEWWDQAEFVARMDDGTIDIVESSFGLAGAVLGRPAIGTGNVAFFPRMNVLFANSEALAQLTGDQRDLLDRAATQVLDTAIANVPQDAEAAAQYCQDGGQVVLATEAQREALRELVVPYVSSLQEDPTTRDAIAGIHDALAGDLASAPVAACGTPVTDQALEPWPLSSEPGPFDGRYRVEVNDDDLNALGATHAQREQARGTYTWTIADGQMSYQQVADNTIAEPRDEFWISVRGDKAMIINKQAGSHPTSANVLWVATWSVAPDGTLRFTRPQPGLNALLLDTALWFTEPFTPLR